MLLPVRTGADGAALDRSAPSVLRISSEVWLIGALTVLGGVLRFTTIASQSYWYDEALTAHEMHLSLGALLHVVRTIESTPPLYSVVAWTWTKVFGTGEAGLRSLSAVAGTLVIPIAYLAGRELVSRRAGLVAASLAAVNPFMIWYSQEARAYMLMAALSGASFLFFARAWREPSARNLAWWAMLSALALLTHFFAALLVAPEAAGLLWKARGRATVAAVAAVGVVEAALLPLVLSDTSHQLSWIKAIPLSIRIKQTPVAFGLGTLYQSSLVTYGLLGAALLGICVGVLLAVGGERTQRRGAAVAAAIAGVVVLVPLLLAELGQDYFLTRNLVPAWIPLAVVVGAACAAPRARVAGGSLAAVLLIGFILAGVRIDGNAQYQRPDWRGVAATLGAASGPRAIVAFDGGFAGAPLVNYLPGIAWNLPRLPWTQSPGSPVTIRELDVVGSIWQTRARVLPAGTKLIRSAKVHDYLVQRFSLAPPWRLSRGQIAARAEGLLGPAPPGAAVLIQPAVRTG